MLYVSHRRSQGSGNMPFHTSMYSLKVLKMSDQVECINVQHKVNSSSVHTYINILMFVAHIYTFKEQSVFK